MKRETAIELSVGALIVSILLLSLRTFLLGRTSFQHDNIFWEYPVFHFFAESLLNGHLPLWNPFEHGGEPFYPLLGAERLFDPTDPLTVWMGSYFTHNTLILDHWARVIKVLVTGLGIYLCVRPWAKTLAARVSLFPLIFFSYYAIGSFREQSYLALFAGVPWIFLFLQRIVFFADSRWLNWIGLGAFIGLNWQFYHFTSVWILLLVFVLALSLFYREGLRNLIHPRIFLSLILCLAMLGPNLYLFFTQNRYVFPVRMIPSDYSPTATPVKGPMNNEGGPENVVTALKLPYAMAAYSGTTATVEDFIRPLIPDFAFVVEGKTDIRSRFYHDGSPYLGIVSWGLCLFGLLFDPRIWFRRIWGFCFLGVSLFMMGRGGGIHPLLYHLYPPVSMLRHTLMLMPIAVFPMLFLIVKGLETSKVSWKFDGKALLLVALGSLTLSLVVSTIAEENDWKVLIPTAFLLWWLDRERTFWVLFLSPIVIAGYLAPNPFGFVLWALLSFAVLFLWQTRRVGVWLVVLFLMGDFLCHLQQSRRLYGERAPAVSLLKIETEARPWIFPKTRGWFAVDFPHDSQAIRYLATLYRKPTIFSTSYAPMEMSTTFEKALKLPRWNSFILPKNYFDLIHSDYPLDKMERAFAAGSEMLRFDSGPENHWSYQVEKYHPGFLRLVFRSDQAGFLFWSDGYAPEWEARIDGYSTKVLLAERAFKRVAVPAGEHVIEFEFRPTLFLVLCGLFYFTFLGSLAAIAVQVLWKGYWISKFLKTRLSSALSFST